MLPCGDPLVCSGARCLTPPVGVLLSSFLSSVLCASSSLFVLESLFSMRLVIPWIPSLILLKMLVSLLGPYFHFEVILFLLADRCLTDFKQVIHTTRRGEVVRTRELHQLTLAHAGHRQSMILGFLYTTTVPSEMI